MVDQVKSPKSIDTRSQRSIVDTTVAILGDSMQYSIARDLQCIELILIVKCLAIANQKCSIMHAEHIYMY